MGLMRKALSVSTLGAVDMRSDKERVAAYAKETRQQAKQQTLLMRQEALLAQLSSPAPTPPVVAAPSPEMQQPDVLETLRRLGELRDQGVVTSDEFDRKKAELLSRL